MADRGGCETRALHPAAEAHSPEVTLRMRSRVTTVSTLAGEVAEAAEVAGAAEVA